IFSDDKMKCFGYGYHGQLVTGAGNSDIGDNPGEVGDSIPYAVLGSFKPHRLVHWPYGEVTPVVGQNHKVKVWGAGDNGRLGLEYDRNPYGDEPWEVGDDAPYINFGTGRSVIQMAGVHGHACV